MVQYTFEQRVFLYDIYVKYGSARMCQRKLGRKCCDERVTRIKTIHSFVNKLRTASLLIDKRREYESRALTKEKLDDIGARLARTPRKSLKHLTQETGVSGSSTRRATHLLKLRPYKTPVIHRSLPAARSS
jgi:hypothetical protein